MGIFSEKRDLEADNPFLNYIPNRINRRQSNIVVRCKQVTQVSSDFSKEKGFPEYVNIVNFVDVMTGSFSQIMDYTG